MIIGISGNDKTIWYWKTGAGKFTEIRPLTTNFGNIIFRNFRKPENKRFDCLFCHYPLRLTKKRSELL